jgi:predicted dehydrogenase
MMQRRDFLQRSSVTAWTALSASRVYGANNRLNIALIGCGGRGRYVARFIAAVPDVQYTAFCDVYDKQAEEARKLLANGSGDTFKDFRRVLERKDIDAVHIATPDHWHAIPAVLACQSQKHVYVEKPFSHNVREGRAMAAAAAKSKAVFLTGTQQRSAPHFAECAEIIRTQLQDVHYVRVWNYANLMPNGIGTEPDTDPPPGLDWDFYLGPAPWVPYNRKRFLSSYRAFFDYSGGWITDYGVHRFDTVHQIMGQDSPQSVAAFGRRYALKGMGDIPDMLQVTWEYPGFIMTYETSSLNGFGAMGRITPERLYYRGTQGGEDRPNGMAFYGSNGVLLADRYGYELIPEGATLDTPFAEKGTLSGSSKIVRTWKNAGDATKLHAEHFIRCIRDDEAPRCDALTGHKASLVAHLGNIAYKTRQRLHWNSERETFEGSPEANALLGRKARKPWDLIS